ncbi:SDR family oxidoreductase [Dietzia sp. ANT_WB102]|uniref:SDR family oxidoreductase n=1 Tax=Dietzia sp. ANT_WB102 TaxID=2597345 RepID=UPI0011ECDA3A|nr:SDR family oxidoreductase [Dietzia sp. ANT_WB102]KAA0918025.1 NAD(P)-dependent oxidoreductase [Dietzia sp. ANT_WB102]
MSGALRAEDLVVVVTGAAGGMGESHCRRLAGEGARILALDVGSAGAAGRLAEICDGIIADGGRAAWRTADIRDVTALAAAVADGVADLADDLGDRPRVDGVVVNAGVYETPGPVWEIDDDVWQRSLDVNLTGAWNTVRATEPHLRDGASLVMVSSTAGLKGVRGAGQYVAAKHGLVGLARTLAMELAPRSIRVNTVHPGSVATPMILNDRIYRRLRPDLENPTREDAAETLTARNLLPVPWVEPEDVSNVILFLVSHESRYITGQQLAVDAGLTAQ